MKDRVNFQNQKEYLQITANQDGFNTACNNISFENRGTVAVNLVLANGKGTYPLAPGASVTYNNPPDTLENNIYNIVFEATAGTKLLLITREHVYRVYGGESEALPPRSFQAAVIPHNNSN